MTDDEDSKGEEIYSDQYVGKVIQKINTESTPSAKANYKYFHPSK